MRIHRTLEEAKDDVIRVGDIIDHCMKSADVCEKLALKCIKSTGKGESQTSALGGAAYFFGDMDTYRYKIPGIITNIINEPLQTEEDKMEDGE